MRSLVSCHPYFLREVDHWLGLESPVPLWSSYGLLRTPYPASNTNEDLPFLHLSHANNLPADDLSLVAKTGTPISSTPDTESQMGMGFPVALYKVFSSNPRTSNVGLGVDCHSSNPSSIVLQARALLTLSRLQQNNLYLKEDKFPAANVLSSSEEAFNIATIRGARSLGLEKDIGSIQKGKKADLVVFDAAGSVGMLSAAEYDPVISILRFSEAADIEYVIVDGKVRKRNGKLVDVKVGDPVGGRSGTLQWKEVAEEVRKSQKSIQERIDKLSLKEARKTLLATFHTDESKLVDATVQLI